MPLAAVPVEVVPAFFSMPTGTEWLIVLVIALLLFGKRLPEIMRGLGSSVREFKKGMDTGPEHHDPVKPVDGAVSRGELPPPHDPNQPKP